MRRVVTSAVASVLVAGSLAACGSGGDNATEAAGGSATAPTAAGSTTATPQDGHVRPFGPVPPRPARIRNELFWQQVVSPGGRHATYLEEMRRGEGALIFSDSIAYFWDTGEQELIGFSEHVDPDVRPETAVDGSAVIFVEQRDPMTRSDGVNPDQWEQRVARWDRTTRTVVGLTDFRYTRVADIALSADGSTVGFFADGGAFVVAADGAAPPDDITDPSVDQQDDFGSGGDAHLSLNGDGTVVGYVALQTGEIYVHDRTTRTSRPLRSVLVPLLDLTHSSHPSLCTDGSLLAFTGSTEGDDDDDDEHQTPSSAFVVDLRSGKIVAKSTEGIRRGVETERAESVVLSPDCRRVAYVAPGAYDGDDLHGDELFKDDAVVVMTVGSDGPARVIETAHAPSAFVAGRSGGLLLGDGSIVALG